MQERSLTDEDWVNYLTRNNVIETREESIKREKILSLLRMILPNFQRKVAQVQDYKRDDIECQLLPFGSYALGGYLRDADIDVVNICPWPVKRHHFFEIFSDLLKQQPTIRDVEVIKRTNVPIIKCTIDSISIDISFVKLRGERLKDNLDLLDDSLLENIDETCLASMDGPRVNKFIKDHILPHHMPLFQRCLQCVKHWAMQRDIYSKPVGYLNGGSWTLLLLKTYMSEMSKPNLNITHILRTFFELWATWPWPTPVTLTHSIPGKNGQSIPFIQLTEFDNSVMPIVSPCYPVSNVAPYVTKSTLKIVTKELERACVILASQCDPHIILTKLFNKLNYFKRYNDFICITTTTTTVGSLDTWTRKMQHNIPTLLQFLEASPYIKQLQVMVNPVITTARYHTLQERYALQHGLTGEDARSYHLIGPMNPGDLKIIHYFVGIQLIDSIKEADLSQEITSFLNVLESKRNRHDEDVKWTFTSKKKIEVAELIGVDTSDN